VRGSFADGRCGKSLTQYSRLGTLVACLLYTF
jgi:hypothetical protein